MIKWLLGYYRLSLCGLTIGFGGTLLIISSWLPLTIKGYHISMWLLLGIVRTLLFILNVRVDCPDPDRLRQHHGFIFPNHMTYLDVLALVSVAPLRFLAKDEVRSMPVIGQVAKSIGCVFVKRDDKSSRAEARNRLAKVETFPPVVLFPEGKRNPGDHLLPFRYGAFEIVIRGQTPFLTCAIEYDQPEVAIWHRGESIIKAALRLAAHDKQIKAQLTPIAVVTPQPNDDPVQMSLAAHEAMTAVLFPTANKQQLTTSS
ncbi:MAG: lysophospholipid acyltransferase family protein [Anaerolineae bacterium]|jgi:1-acyl-sn-glycerol-3-phosphate acyltransferase